MLKRLYVMLLASGLLLPCALSAQQTTAPSLPAIIHTTRGEVLFDMVVTDSHNKIISDLKPDEISVLDNGVPQTIISFRKVAESVHLTPADLLAAGVSQSGLQTQSLPTFNLVTLVFGNIDAGGRALARSAAESFIRNDMGPNDYVAIYDIDTALYVLQSFTADRSRLLKAIDAATRGTSTEFKEMNRDVAEEVQKAASVAQAASHSSSNGPPSQSEMSAMAESRMEQMVSDAMTMAANADTTNSSRITLNSLLSILQGQHILPGRKSLVYFTEQMPVNSNTAFLFRGLIDAANRANVTFYTVDPTGLSLESDNAQSAEMLQVASAVSKLEGRAGHAVTMAEANNSDLTESIEYSSRHMMQSLASSTGGFFAGNTNDLRPQMARIASDISGHYELSYVPASGADGKFHSIEVRVNRPRVIVRARTGYYALPAMHDPVFPYEAPLFAIEHVLPPPEDFSLNQTELDFSGASGHVVDVATEFPLQGFTFKPVRTKSGKGVSTHFVAMYLVEDMQGNILKKMSEDFPLTGPQNLPQRKMIFERTITLPAGMYHVRTILYDPESKKASLRTTLLSLPAITKEKIGLSSIAVVARTEPTKDTASPLFYQNVKIVPDISEPLVKGKTQQVGLFFRVYPPKDSKPQLIIAFKRDGKIIGKAAESLPAPQADGSVPVLAGFPLAGFPAGQYEADVVVLNGQQSAMQTAFFTVQ